MCDQCEKTFSQKGNFNRHMLTHAGDKPHVCEQCLKAFSSIVNLNKHVLTHSKGK